jgi:translation initiation factor 2 subunit 1
VFDQEKGYIDLSKRKVSAAEVAKCEQSFSQAKQVHSIMRQMATMHSEWSLEEWCSKVAWPLDRIHKSAYLGFKKWINDEEDVFAALDIPDELKKALDGVVRKRMMPTAMKLVAKVEVSCLEYEGIDSVKESLMEGFKADSKEVPLQIKLIAPPQYAIVTTMMDKEAGTAKIDEAMGYIKEAIEKRGGTFAIKSKPEIVGDLDADETGAGEDASGSESGSSDSESDQDETMGAANFDEEAFLKKTGGAVTED